MMERDEIIRLAKEAFDVEFISESDGGKLERFAQLVAAEYKRDAERYRWLASDERSYNDIDYINGEDLLYKSKEAIDAAIDAAIGETK